MFSIRNWHLKMFRRTQHWLICFTPKSASTVFNENFKNQKILFTYLCYLATNTMRCCENTDSLNQYAKIRVACLVVLGLFVYSLAW